VGGVEGWAVCGMRARAEWRRHGRVVCVELPSSVNSSCGWAARPARAERDAGGRRRPKAALDGVWKFVTNPAARTPAASTRLLATGEAVPGGGALLGLLPNRDQFSSD
jgi:hypothetical protein